MRAILVVLLAATSAFGQTPAPPVAVPPRGPIHVVVYLEVAPRAQQRMASALKRYREGTRQEHDNLRVEVLQGAVRKNHFALVEAWPDQGALDAHQRTVHGSALRDLMREDGLAPPDERLLRNTNAAEGVTRAASKGTFYVLTHADALPPASRGTDILLPLASASRTESGNVRFDVLVQPTRLNHFTLVEVWKDGRAFESHITAPHTKEFREKFLRVTGALYDERLYTALR